MTTAPLPTLVLSPRYTVDSQALWRAAIQRGWHVIRLTTWTTPPVLAPGSPCVLYLEGLLAQTLAAALGVQLPEPPDDWLTQLPRAYRQRQIALTTAGDAAGQLPAFLKPPNDKSFAARVYQSGEPLPADPEQPVLRAEPVVWEQEWRCFVLDRTLRTVARYAWDGAPPTMETPAPTVDEERALTAFVGQVLADAQVWLPRAAVLDVGVIADRGWAVVELNAAWGAGIYDCDPDQVLDVIRWATEARPSDTPALNA